LGDLPDYGAYHTTLIADPALPGKWQPGEDVVYLLVFEGEMVDGSSPASQVRSMLTVRLTEALPFPILGEWHDSLWEFAQMKNLIAELPTGGDCQVGFVIQLDENGWKEVVVGLLKERKIHLYA
jgi:hypothetical protein